MHTLGIWTLFYKELLRIKEIWLQGVLAPVVSNLLFLMVFGVAFSSSPSPAEGVSYLGFLIPGLAAMGAMTNSVQNPMFSLIVAKFTNNIQELLMIPLKGFEICLAYVGGGIVRGMVVGIVTVIVGLFFARMPFEHPLLILLFALLLTATFSSLGAIIGILSKEFDDAMIIPTFVLTPLMYLGGVFYSVSSLPPTFAWLSKFNPLFYMIDGFRYGFLGVGEAPILLSFAVCVVSFAITFGVASWMFATGYRLKT